MEATDIIGLLIAVLIFFVALLHSTMGLAGAASYLAIMALLGPSPVVMKPVALALNIIVGLVCTVQFCRAGFFSWRTFWPFAATSVPASFIGGGLMLPDVLNRLLVGLVLFYAGARLFWAVNLDGKKTAPVPILIALPLGAAMGLLSGFTGIGGGIFLSPVLLLMGWAGPNEMRGVSAAFILANSVAGLLPRVSGLLLLPDGFIYWAPAALVGAWIGTELQDATRELIIRLARMLSLVPALAGIKLVL